MTKNPLDVVAVIGSAGSDVNTNATWESEMKNPAAFMRRWLSCVLIAGSASLALQAGPAGAATIPESTDPIKLAMNEWTSQNLLTQITGRLLKKMGYNVDYVTAGYTAQLTPLSAGELTASMEIWEVNVGEGFQPMLQSGKLESLGSTGLEGGGGWVYPTFAEKLCPGLPDYKALLKCPDVFATPETMPQGRLVDFPPEWGNMHTADRLASLGIDFKPVSGGSEGAMLSELRSSVKSGKPALVYFWWPHPIFVELDLKVVDLPKYADPCYTDPKWGPNPDKTYDCGEAAGDIVKVVWPGMKEKWPAAYKLIQAFKIGNKEDMELSYEIESKGQKVEDVADRWIAEHQAVWQPWIEAAQK